MWLFGKKQKDLKSLPPFTSAAQPWAVAKGDHGGAPLLVRFNAGAKEWVGHKGLPVKLGFAVPLNTPNDGGLPDPAENELLNAVEDVILGVVEPGVTGVFAMVLTTGTMREFVFYIAPGADIGTLHETIRDRVSTHDVQCMAEMEPKWDTYAQFVPE